MYKFLIIDDSAAMRSQLRKVLEELGHVCVGEGINGFDGVQKFIELKPDLVFLDVVMPEMDGFTALTKIMEFEKTAKVIMVSSAATTSNVSRAKKSGALQFIPKPVEKQSLALCLLEIGRVLESEKVAKG